MLSKKSKYALKAAMCLARNHGEGGPTSVAELAAKERIPRKFLEIIMLEMKRHGILRSLKGQAGGYYLARAPEEITIGQIIRILDGPLALVPCVSITAYRRCTECEDEYSCGIRLLFKEIRDATANLLDGTTLAQLVSRVEQRHPSSDSAPMYHI